MDKKRVSEKPLDKASCIFHAGYIRGFAEADRVPTAEDKRILIQASEELRCLAKLLDLSHPERNNDGLQVCVFP